MRTVLIGDVHGCYDELIELCDRVGLTAEDRLLSLGDVVDRGPKPAEVICFLRQRPNTLVLMGNHERKHVRQIFSLSQEITLLQLGDGYGDAVLWMSTLPYWHETADFIAAHAALSPGMAIDTQREDVLAGTISGEQALEKELGSVRWCDCYSGEKPIIVGHYVVKAPEVVRDRVWFIDTGACHGGALTALIVPGFTLASVKARTDHWVETRRIWQPRVITSRPWAELSWQKARRDLERLSEGVDPAVETVETWLAAVEALLPRCVEALEAIESEPALPILVPFFHMKRRGRLTLDAVRKRCPTPRRALDLATALGLPELSRLGPAASDSQ